jgi:hypothetical protein
MSLDQTPARSLRPCFARAAWLAAALVAVAGGSAGAPPSDHDQLVLELLNRARMNPVAEAALHGIDLNEGLAPGTIPPDPVAPLAFDERLIDAAIDHTDWMLASNVFSHTGAGGSELWQRIEAAGYLQWLTVGENLVWRGTSGSLSEATILDFVHQTHSDLFLSPGHRENLLAPLFKDVGVGTNWGPFAPQGTTWNSVVASHDFGAQSLGPAILTGVVFDDLDLDAFYTPGEGWGGVGLVARRQSDGATYATVTWATGGYALEVFPGTYDITVQGAGVGPDTVEDVMVGIDNVKVDFVLPEPGRTAGLAAGLLLLAGLSRLRAPRPRSGRAARS